MVFLCFASVVGVVFLCFVSFVSVIVDRNSRFLLCIFYSWSFWIRWSLLVFVDVCWCFCWSFLVFLLELVGVSYCCALILLPSFFYFFTHPLKYFRIPKKGGCFKF